MIGAFTGAEQLRKGRFELADSGTLLLDEISEISPALQAKLLRVLQERAFERVGSSLTMEVDVRVIATTNRDLRQSVSEGTFRQDLYYRLNVLPIVIPPLRERIDDIPLLADHFLSRMAVREGREPKRFADGAIDLLKAYNWPGNVRELENICERASVLSSEPVIDPDVIRPWFGASKTSSSQGIPLPWEGATPVQVSASPLDEGPIRPLEETEREEILRALKHHNGNRVRTAKVLGIGVRTLGLKLKKWKELKLVAETV